MDCPCCATPLETHKVASVNFDICHSCLGVWLPIQAVAGIVSARGMAIDRFMATLLNRIRKIERGTYTDKLTGLGNRKFFDRQLGAEISRARGSHFLSLVLLDLDGFKAANDLHGHGTGDFVLKEFGELIARFIRKSDCAARVGGDEFGIILPETDVEGARAIAVRIVKETADKAFRTMENLPLSEPIHVSCGIACYPTDLENGQPDDPHGGEECRESPRRDGATDVADLHAHLFDLADTALYAAKERGRNRAVAAGDLTEEERAQHVLAEQR